MQQNYRTDIDASGANYFMKGFELIRLKGIRRFVFIPLIVNLLFFSLAFYYIYLQLDVYIAKLDSFIPDWLDFIHYIIWPVALIAILISFTFIFSAVANWIAAPFNGLLAEKMEAMLTGEPAPNTGFTAVLKDIPRTLSREWTKFIYYLPRAIGFFLLYWFVPVIGQVLWFLFLAWMMAIQYKDYPFDNHKVPFFEMRRMLKENKGTSYSFGVTAAIFSMIPIINLIVMPVAICGATALWVDRYKQYYD
ncbi:sulfate transporter CysZ [Thalassotalea agarivorans]|uniref:Sulfate transporter CysZ n=1 Tax=Thalassotalea agarivorans TaxID=349064 RepID=A0A1I0BZF0_THASX|nr:sulfate transporter CysZ [Thalassotalea agarivorans]SET12224.1 CysZ protein [Thalassotalea agarivorans]